MRLFYFKNTRKPDFGNVKKFDYNAYWDSRGFALRTKLMERERIFFDWIPAGSRVLDVGCGNSRLLYELKTKKNCPVLGLDISPKVVNELNRLGVPAKVADLEAGLPTDLGHVDYIIASEVLEHLKYPEDLVAQLKPLGKHLIVSVPNSAFYRYRLHLLFTGRFFTQWAVHPAEHLRYWSHKDFLEWLGAQGLHLEKFKAAAGFELMDVWPNLFCATGCYLARTVDVDTRAPTALCWPSNLSYPMPNSSTTPLTKAEFGDWATTTKQTLNSIEGELEQHTERLTTIERTLGEHTRQLAAIEHKLEPLERIATSLKRIEENTTAMLRLYDRLDHRDQVFAGKLNVDLAKVDAEV